MTGPTWRDALEPYATGALPLLTPAFLRAHGSRNWQPTDDDGRAAALLHLELTSRISTQEIGYSSGVEASALQSVHALFERAREICREHLPACSFETLTWFVLNHHVRPFTSRWHRRSLAGGLQALDETDDFRLQLDALQEKLREFDRLLLFMRGDQTIADVVGEEIAEIGLEMAKPLPWGLDQGDPTRLDGVSGLDASTMAQSERVAIERRRAHYGLDVNADRATGLALSGGGIRSATFALGVLTVFARRGLLRQFDYLSTVSGGGYLGAFLTNFLAAAEAEPVPMSPPSEDEQRHKPNVGSDPANAVGLRRGNRPFEILHRDGAAIGHIRQSSRYLASGPIFEKWSVVLSQASGLLTNLLALAAVVCLFPAMAVIAVGFLPSPWRSFIVAHSGIMGPSLLALLFAAILVSPLLWRLGRFGVRFADWAAAVCAALLGLVILVSISRRSASGFSAFVEADQRRLAVVLVAPLALLILGVTLERLWQRGQFLARWLARSAAPAFILAVTSTFVYALGRYPERAVVIACLTVLLTIYYLFFLNINVTGLHRHYRRKLADAFLVVEDGPGSVKPDADRLLSTLSAGSSAPYPILNAALNVPSSKRPAMRGRLTDFFSFTPDHCGSPITGYFATAQWENLEQDLNLATAMAISGAAISPRMGLQNKVQFSFWLSLLNIRLGYWLRNPGRKLRRFGGRPGLLYLLRELSGLMDEKSAFLNLSDGGHIENLGVYELLMRRCKFIVVVDGEQDQKMTFHAIANLQRLASIDLGVRIDIDLDELRLDEKGLSRSHFQFCRVNYPGGDIGYLVYVKLSLTGNEGEFLRRFRLDEPDFPHHPTADQNFTEARFEAYRSLGQHVGEKLFLKSIVREVADTPEVDIDSWFASLGRSFLEPLPSASLAAEPVPDRGPTTGEEA